MTWNERKLHLVPVIVRLRKRGLRKMGCHTLATFSRYAGEPMSTKTIMKILRRTGATGPGKVKVGMWSKRTGRVAPYRKRNKWTSTLPEPAGWSQQPEYRRKNRTLDPRLVAVAQAFSAWFSNLQSGGEFDLEAVLSGEKPP